MILFSVKVSNGILFCVFELLVIDSPVDGIPCDELDILGPCVVVFVNRKLLVPQNRFIAPETYVNKWKLLLFRNETRNMPMAVNYLWLTSNHYKYEYSLQYVYQIGYNPIIIWATKNPRQYLCNPCHSHHNDQFHTDTTKRYTIWKIDLQIFFFIFLSKKTKKKFYLIHWAAVYV